MINKWGSNKSFIYLSDIFIDNWIRRDRDRIWGDSRPKTTSDQFTLRGEDVKTMAIEDEGSRDVGLFATCPSVVPIVY